MTRLIYVVKCLNVAIDNHSIDHPEEVDQGISMSQKPGLSAWMHQNYEHEFRKHLPGIVGRQARHHFGEAPGTNIGYIESIQASCLAFPSSLLPPIF